MDGKWGRVRLGRNFKVGVARSVVEHSLTNQVVLDLIVHHHTWHKPHVLGRVRSPEHQSLIGRGDWVRRGETYIMTTAGSLLTTAQTVCVRSSLDFLHTLTCVPVPRL